MKVLELVMISFGALTFSAAIWALAAFHVTHTYNWLPPVVPTPYELHCRQVRAYNLTQPMPHARIYGCP